jgi:hypothetical protein
MKRVACTGLGSCTIACVLLAHAGSVGGAQTMTRHFTPRDQQLGRYQYVPFDVPAGTTKIGVSYAYDRAGGANVIDLGVYEPGPLDLATRSFRGWSGGEQASVSIGVDRASPGYWPGPLPAGRWHAQLGLYKIGADGVDVDMTVETSTAPATGPAPSVSKPAAAPVRTGAAWYVGALHAHSDNSDGALTPQQLADKARGENLDFLAITDHNNTVHQAANVNAPGLLLIVGEEATTPGGHFNVWGLGGARDYVDFRVLSGDPAIHVIVADARARGALVSINHPISACSACTWTHPVPDGVSAIEISDTGTQSPAAVQVWDTVLRQGRRITAVGTSDWHRGAAPLGAPAVRVWADNLSTPAILSGISAGHVVVVANSGLPAPTFTARSADAHATTGDELRAKSGERVDIDIAENAYSGATVDLFWNGERIDSATMSPDGRAAFERFATASGYYRVHISRGGTLLAVTNPIYIAIRTS